MNSAAVRESAVGAAFESLRPALVEHTRDFNSAECQRLIQYFNVFLRGLHSSRDEEGNESHAPQDGRDHLLSQKRWRGDSMAELYHSLREHLWWLRGFLKTATAQCRDVAGVAGPLQAPRQSGGRYDLSVPAYEIDEFLYSEDADIDELVDAGKVSRFYCTRCGSSTELRPTQFVTHSFSLEQLLYFTAHVLPLVETSFNGEKDEGKRESEIERAVPRTLVDVGSRYGIVIAAALVAVAGSASTLTRLVGVEISASHVAVQRQAIAALQQRFQRGNMRERNCEVQLVEGNIVEAEGLQLLCEADVVVLHNVFEWFSDGEQETIAWRAIQKAVSREGQAIIASPALVADDETQRWVDNVPLEKEQMRFLESWLADHRLHRQAESCSSSQRQPDNAEEDVADAIRNIFLYRVRGS